MKYNQNSRNNFHDPDLKIQWDSFFRNQFLVRGIKSRADLKIS